ncbi:GNAT family N-acetyltransferase [Flavobacteriaceae bacterium]|nr:GNAT family N-acetyltransferase [Flavobacteriaceae bacterium]
MKSYKALNNQIYSTSIFSLVPIRFEDKFDIMKWRNEQLYHLRQSKPLTIESQENYFNNVVSKLFEQKQPSQILFSFLKNNTCIGYGGLVHINWIDKHAEVSFIMDTYHDKNAFQSIWNAFLSLIEEVAFKEIKLHKIFTYAFDLRPQLYPILLKAGYTHEARLNEHSFFENRFIDVLIHSKFNDKI